MDTAAPRKFSASDGLAAVAGLVLAGVVIWTASDSPDPDPSLATALSRLAGDPLDTDALRVVGLDRAWRGDIRGATRLLSFVESRTWRDGPAEVWLLGHRLDRHDYDGALKAADSLLRRDPDGEVRPVLFPALTALAAYPEARPALSARLAKSPWWRDRFLTFLATHGEAVGARRVFADLAGGPTPPSPDDYAPFINRLVADQDHAGALAAWREIARPPGGASDNLAFSDVSDHTPFTWSPAAGVGATSETTALGGATTLRTDYDGFSTPDLPSRLLVLAPGVLPPDLAGQSRGDLRSAHVASALRRHRPGDRSGADLARRDAGRRSLGREKPDGRGPGGLLPGPVAGARSLAGRAARAGNPLVDRHDPEVRTLKSPQRDPPPLSKVQTVRRQTWTSRPREKFFR